MSTKADQKRKADEWKAKCKVKRDEKKLQENPGLQWVLVDDLAKQYNTTNGRIMAIAMQIIIHRGWNIHYGTINKPAFEKAVAKRGGIADLLGA